MQRVGSVPPRSQARNVVLLSTGGKESESKRLHFAQAADALGFRVADRPDRHTACVIPCSDFKAFEAALMCREHGVPGPDPIAASIATHKSLTYHFLARRGFRTLRWSIPLEDSDLKHGFDRPVIVKPDRGSGSYAVHPWAYRVFGSVSAFRRFLVRNRLLEGFLRYQGTPSYWNGRYLVMEYVPNARLYGVAAAIGDRKAKIYDVHEMGNAPGSAVVDRILFGETHRDMESIAAIPKAFASIGLRRVVCYVQCVERAGRLYPIDLNLRPGSMFDLAVDALKLPFYTDLLRVFTGVDQKMRFAWPHPRVGVRRLVGVLRPGTCDVTYGAGGIPLVDRISYDVSRRYDLGRAWPLFAVPCRNRGEFERKSAAIAEATTISQKRRRSTVPVAASRRLRI